MKLKNIFIIAALSAFLALVYLAIPSNTGNSNTNSKTSLHEILDGNWVNNTIKLINASRTIDGGYAEFHTEPKLYSTYYFVLRGNLITSTNPGVLLRVSSTSPKHFSFSIEINSANVNPEFAVCC
jgi:hypothetical protein